MMHPAQGDELTRAVQSAFTDIYMADLAQMHTYLENLRLRGWRATSLANLIRLRQSSNCQLNAHSDLYQLLAPSHLDIFGSQFSELDSVLNRKSIADTSDIAIEIA